MLNVSGAELTKNPTANTWGSPPNPLANHQHHFKVWVERLIANLLDNALRYNVPSSRAEISTRVEGDKAILSIANTGLVIPPEQVRRLFDPFQRLDRTRVDDHHGLGLSIVRAIPIARDATLTADEQAQGGLSTQIHFPLIPFAMPR